MSVETRNLMEDALRIENARSIFALCCSSLSETHPNWDRKKDARITAFAACGNTLSNVHLGMVLAATCLNSSNWWTAVFPKAEAPSLRVRISQEYNMFLKMGLAHFLFSVVESSYRLFLRAIDAQACLGSTGAFRSVYVCLLSRVGLDAKWTNFMEFWRLIRNSIHTNGMHLPSNERDQDVEFEGVVYHFRSGQPVDCATWDNLFTIVERTAEMLKDVVTSDALSVVPHIEDPFAGPRPGMVDVSQLTS
jgi:hypothetical protein